MTITVLIFFLRFQSKMAKHSGHTDAKNILNYMIMMIIIIRRGNDELREFDEIHEYHENIICH